MILVYIYSVLFLLLLVWRPVSAQVGTWNGWSVWGACSQSCETGFTSRSRTCSTGQNLDCRGLAVAYEACNIHECAAPSWLSWESWTTCTKFCGTEGLQVRSRLCSLGVETECFGSPFETRACNIRNCFNVVVAEWINWQNWGACNVPCGGGVRIRIRVCNTRRSADCGFINEETESCNIHECPVLWGRWTTWSYCSKSCGDGSRRRTRTCSTGIAADCGEPRSAIVRKLCNTQACPFSFVWDNWGQWTICSQTCGVGMRRRSRTCPTGLNRDCGTLSRQLRRCNTQECPFDFWNNWTQWTSCTKSCASGSRRRTRTCSSGKNSDCGSIASQTTSCNTRSCPRWNDWNGWTSCSATCGTGNRFRTRSCTSGRNEDCGSQSRQTSACNVRRCASWNAWNQWTTCSKSCDRGSRFRSRICNTGINGDCPGTSSQTTSCNRQLSRTWTAWTNWSACSLSCGVGRIRRSRSCSTGNDIDCGLSALETLTCNTQPCPSAPFWNSWTSWSQCSAICGRGITERRRSCSSGINQDCGSVATELINCNTQPCPTQQDVWSQWSPCTVSCGTGERFRIRLCSNRECTNSARQTTDCYEGPCSVVQKRNCICVDATCSDSVNGNCDVFAPHCATFPSYVALNCRLTCGLCQPEYTNSDCNCTLPNSFIRCPVNYALRYNSTTSCCIVPTAPSCGISVDNNNIVEEQATQTQWPWMVFVRTPTSTCGAVLISERWLIAAAHCLANVEASQVTIRVGGSNSIYSRTFFAQSITLHPLFSINAVENIIENDIAIVQLPVGVTLNPRTQPICLAGTAQVVPSQWKCFVAGWNLEIPDEFQTLEQLSVRIVSDASCKVAYDSLQSNMICATSDNSTMDHCAGDSGGPLMCQLCQTCEWYIVGITTLGSARCGVSGQPGVYTRIASHEVWINQITGISPSETSSC
ncbi:unnamed protein product [Clavelina lepadiformis]|uniref:Uncharacterized protein n=1 Tax=Clavelina lepadiformis TaxID=159417 RepID=A0ABP0FB25_CLALP